MTRRGKNRFSFLSFFGIFLIFLSIFILIFFYVFNHSKEGIALEEIEEYIENTSIEESTENIDEPIKEEEPSINYEYVAVLDIPDINLKRGLVDYNSKYNDVKYNIEIIEHSTMPDVEKGNLILASHNGSSSVSFFRNLSKIKRDSLIYIYYNGYKYVYKFNNSYEVEKTGKVDIVRDRTQTTITLITCKSNSKTKQIVYIGYLIDKTEY